MPIRTHQEEEAVVEEFRRRRKLQFILTVPMALAAGGLVIAADRGKSGETAESAMILMPLAIIAIVVLAVFSLMNWRCPACNSYLGKSFSPHFCHRCGARLAGEG